LEGVKNGAVISSTFGKSVRLSRKLIELDIIPHRLILLLLERLHEKSDMNKKMVNNEKMVRLSFIPAIPSSEITPETAFRDRRRFLSMTGALAAGSALPALDALAQGNDESTMPALPGKTSSLSTDEKKTPWEDATRTNNFYEFGTYKDDPARNAHMMHIRPWQLIAEGEIHKPKTFDLDELLKLAPMEERIYRLRCVEGWSMVLPWTGYSLSELIRRIEPTGNAKYVEFTSLADPKQMPGLKNRVLDWPYVEALRLDEALHPLTLLCFGLYRKTLLPQSGAPVRIIAPWKYGFKSGKSIVKIRLTEAMPTTSWMRANPREYGFYANVNPNVPHPRWSQATERRLGEAGRRDTLIFNGYADQVASLYAGMDLKKHF